MKNICSLLNETAAVFGYVFIIVIIFDCFFSFLNFPNAFKIYILLSFVAIFIGNFGRYYLKVKKQKK